MSVNAPLDGKPWYLELIDGHKYRVIAKTRKHSEGEEIAAVEFRGIFDPAAISCTQSQANGIIQLYDDTCAPDDSGPNLRAYQARLELLDSWTTNVPL